VSADFPNVHDDSDEPGEKFSARAAYTSVGALVVGWLVLVGLDVGGVIGGEAFTIGCVGVLVVVAYFAYMWGTRTRRREIARRIARAEGYRRDVRSGRYRRR
jgi:hypothetical protein